ncbi:Dynein light chain Tctex-type [Colletotrichum orbiculare MAFF 240422]|uniref:Dynein light chain Tctex-type n=1 Tax=Colletotrichum orbiculare (strain 104-T / ATCC 96160 / CBS 514.97 / LARS 414 / MAFF 240422) TaxID=1213857 RepID=A0A484GAE0_COLOR|nr:Dynein light chain Tctex-type [Colletotrichum orbiculare MAFF 240422]
MSAPTTATPPVAFNRLKQIATDACQSAIGAAEFYDHAKTEQWNSQIISSVLKAVISESTPQGGSAPAYNPKPHVGRRGMHSATGAYWDEKKDGMWSYKYDGGEGKGMDVVIMLIWVAI